jgi:uncharacterized membrane protein YgdD (TMEM256/DUF423 family)
MDRVFAVLGAIGALLGVAAGAFGAHALKARLSADALAIFDTAVRYQMWHALALFAVAWAGAHWRGRALPMAGWLFVAGIVLFSGSLYALALGGWRTGAAAPIGGTCLLLGWIALAWGVWFGDRSS